MPCSYSSPAGFAARQTPPSPVADRAAVVTTTIIQLIFRQPTARDLREQIEALLRDELVDIERQLLADIRLRDP